MSNIALTIDSTTTNSDFFKSEKSVTFIKNNELSFTALKDDLGVTRSDKCQFNVKSKDPLTII